MSPLHQECTTGSRLQQLPLPVNQFIESIGVVVPERGIQTPTPYRTTDSEAAPAPT